MEWRYVYSRDEILKLSQKWCQQEMWREWTLPNGFQDFMIAYDMYDDVDNPRKVQGPHIHHRERERNRYSRGGHGHHHDWPSSRPRDRNNHENHRSAKGSDGWNFGTQNQEEHNEWKSIPKPSRMQVEVKSEDQQKFMGSTWKGLQKSSTEDAFLLDRLRGIRAILNKWTIANSSVVEEEWKQWFKKEQEFIGGFACWITLIELEQKINTERKINIDWLRNVYKLFEQNMESYASMKVGEMLEKVDDKIREKVWKLDGIRLPFISWLEEMRDMKFIEAYHMWFVRWIDWVFMEGCFRPSFIFDANDEWELFSNHMWEQWVQIAFQHIAIQKLPYTYMNRMIYYWKDRKIPDVFPKWFLWKWFMVCYEQIVQIFPSKIHDWKTHFATEFQNVNQDELPMKIRFFWEEHFQNVTPTTSTPSTPRQMNTTRNNNNTNTNTQEEPSKKHINENSTKREKRKVMFSMEDLSNMRCLLMEWRDNDGYGDWMDSYLPESFPYVTDSDGEYLQQIWNCWLELSLEIHGLQMLQNAHLVSCSKWLWSKFPSYHWINEWKETWESEWNQMDMDYTVDDLRSIFQEFIALL